MRWMLLEFQGILLYFSCIVFRQKIISALQYKEINYNELNSMIVYVSKSNVFAENKF